MHTPGPYEIGHHPKNKNVMNPNKWVYVEHNFPDYPYEGDLEEEYGIYPPLGEAGPVALVSGKDNARLFASAPDLLAACEALVKYRDRAGALNFQLEKADDYIRNIRAAIAKARGED